MHESDRIDEFCAELAKTWHNVPNWRFGQLIMNLCYGRDPMSLDNDEMLALLQQGSRGHDDGKSTETRDLVG